MTGHPEYGRLPRVLLLGDSIRQGGRGYQTVVRDLLKEFAEVVGPEENCRTSAVTLAALPEWLAKLGKPDVAHWNNGLHDSAHMPGRDPVQHPLEAYVENLNGILAILRRTGAKIIWATTTPVHPNRPFQDTETSWRNHEIDRYNRAAEELMRRERIPVNDLHRLVLSHVDEYLEEDMLHLSDAGQAACARAVAEAVRRVLADARLLSRERSS